MHSKSLGLGAISVAALLATACSSTPRRPPPSQMQMADVSVGRADEGRVGDYAAPELRDAHEKLNAARELDRTAQANKDSTAALHAKWLAQEASADADLAAAKAQLSRSQEINIELQREVDRMTVVPANETHDVVSPTNPDSGTNTQP